METLECLAKRASIRKYRKAILPEEDVHAILNAGFEAPSASNRRPYELVVNSDNDFWQEFVKEKATCEIIRNAGLTVLVVADPSKNPAKEFDYEDCSLVAENMLLAATALGYGSLWLGIPEKSAFSDKLTSYFHLPKGDFPVALLAFGAAAEEKKQPNRFDPAKIHYGKF